MVWKTFESTLDCKEIKLVNPKRNQPRIFFGRTDVKAEVPILWSHYVRNRLFRKDPDAGKDGRQREKGWQRIRWLGSITNSMDMNFSKLWEAGKDREAWFAAQGVIDNLLTEKLQ